MPGLADFKGKHQGKEIIVCGCGESLRDLAHPERFITIGVNDMGRLFHPDYLVVVNPRRQFAGERFRYVEQSQAKYLFTQLDLGIPHPNIVKFRLGTYGGTNGSDPNVLHYTQNSPYVAVCLAAHMGARRIGIIGVDFTDNHFFGKTGRHALANQLTQINEQYRKLRESLNQRGIEVFNLSARSRLTSIPRMTIEEFAAVAEKRAACTDGQAAEKSRSRIFFVHYRFLAAGDVFAQGLRSAAEELGVVHEHAFWDDVALPEKVRTFKPDLLFVVHGRRFIQKWRDQFRNLNTAVWLTEEPYEVDDSSKWSSQFKTVFVNDLQAVQRHKNGHYLPVCYDPGRHRIAAGVRRFKAGFIGAHNETRERLLSRLAREGLMSYVVGGPWRDKQLQDVNISSKVPPEKTAELYRQTELVVNVFRDVHHYNRSRIPGWSMNPRVYEALACGALVVSEDRPEIRTVFPEMPVFGSADELAGMVRDLLKDDEKRETLRAACQKRLNGHAYCDRLKTIIGNVCDIEKKTEKDPVQFFSQKNVIATVEALGELDYRELPDINDQGENVHSLVDKKTISSFPIRNLIYHIWPVKDSSWRWNIEELLKRIDIFNGKRVISIVHDARSEDSEIVKQAFAGHGCEFLVAHNDPKGESAAFPRLLDAVKSTDVNEVTFYGHAKGVKYGKNLSAPLRKWIQALYRVNLDDWLSVKNQLNRYAMTGAFKMRGRFAAHRNTGDWHYSGTFFWFRNSEVFSRDFRNVPDFYYGVEAWPGLLFSPEETGCLFLDGIRELAYLDRFWRLTGDPELGRWESRMRAVVPPADLVKPVPYEGHEWPRLEQIPHELDWWIRNLRETGVRHLLTIGAGHGGMEWHVARKMREQGKDIEITALDISDRPEISSAFEDARSRFGQRIKFLRGDSTCLAMREQLEDYYDAVFIDSDHSYRTVASDFQLALSRKPRVIGLHDIVDSDWHVSARCCVSRLWAEIKAEHKTAERMHGAWGGIGIIWLM